MPRGTVRGRLRRMMDERRLTVAELSRRSNVGVSVIRNILNSSLTYPRLYNSRETYDGLASALGVTVEYLRDGRVTRSILDVPATDHQRTITRLEERIQEIETRRNSMIAWANGLKLNILYVDNKYHVVQDNEFVIGEGDTMLDALRAARDNSA